MENKKSWPNWPNLGANLWPILEYLWPFDGQLSDKFPSITLKSICRMFSRILCRIIKSNLIPITTEDSMFRMFSIHRMLCRINPIPSIQSIITHHQLRNQLCRMFLIFRTIKSNPSNNRMNHRIITYTFKPHFTNKLEI